MFRFIASIATVSALGVSGGVLAASHLSWLTVLGILILVTTVGSVLAVCAAGWVSPHPCVAGNMLLLFGWLPFLVGCWVGVIVRWAL